MAEDKRQQPHSAGRTAAKWFGIAAASVVGLVLLTLCALSLYLTPERLTSIINREASQYLEADVQATNVRYTLWRSFPRFDVQTDSIVVRSRTLDSIPDSIRRQLPANADFLGAVKSFSGSINVVDLFIRRYVIHDVKADGLRVNLVSYNDSINNYEIVPSSGAGLKKVPYFSAHFVDLQNPGGIDYLSVSSDTKASLDLRSLTLRRLGNLLHPDNDYALALAGKVTARSAGIDILHDFPFDLNGKVRLRFDPFGFSLSDYRIDLGRLRTTLSMSLGMGENPRIESFDYRISKVNLLNLLGYIPKEYIPDLQGLNADMQVEASARLLSSWNLQSGRLPSIAVDFTVPRGHHKLHDEHSGAQRRTGVRHLRRGPLPNQRAVPLRRSRPGPERPYGQAFPPVVVGCGRERGRRGIASHRLPPHTRRRRYRGRARPGGPCVARRCARRYTPGFYKRAG